MGIMVIFLVAAPKYLAIAPQIGPSAKAAAGQDKDKAAPQPVDKTNLAELRNRSKMLVRSLREIHARWHDASMDAFSRLKGPELYKRLSEIDRTNRNTFFSEYRGEGLSLEGALLRKLGTQNYHGDPTAKYQGASVLHSGILAGAAPLEAIADYLEGLTSELE